jgi:hypothetical protein
MSGIHQFVVRVLHFSYRGRMRAIKRNEYILQRGGDLYRPQSGMIGLYVTLANL